MSDKLQAMEDALKAILQARQGGGGPSPDGDIETEIDPDLEQAAPKDGGIDPNDYDVEDPDNVLDKLKNKQNNPQQQQGGTGGNSQDDDDDDDDDEGDNSDSDGDDEEESDSDGEEESPNSQGQSSQSNKSSGKASANHNEEDDEDDEDEEADLDDEGEEDLDDGDDEEYSPYTDEYKDAWNEVMTRFDTDDYSEKDIKRLINQINNGEISEL